MSRKITYLATLAEALAEHENVTESAISMRVFGKGDFFQKFRTGKRKSINVDGWFDAMHWFDENWPADLEWPSGIQRISRARLMRRA
jgi:hypothetical protein